MKELKSLKKIEAYLIIINALCFALVVGIVLAYCLHIYFTGKWYDLNDFRFILIEIKESLYEN